MIRNQILVIAGLLIVSFIEVKAQQSPQYTHYMYNMNVVNPAYAGSKEFLSIGVLGRSQWEGVNGGPQTFTMGIHAPVMKNVGMGFSIISDKVGPVEETNVYADFSYTIRTSDHSNLALGLKGGATFQNIGLLSLTQVNPDDPLFAENVNRVYPNFGVGVYYHMDKMYMGLSMPNILKSRHFEKGGGKISSASEEMNAFFTGGYVFELSDFVKFKPSFMTRLAFNAPLAIDVSANFLFNEKVELGISYRLKDAIGGLINIKISNNMRIGYSYDYTTSAMGDFSTGSHEVFMLYDFVFLKGKFKSPRFF